MKTIAIIPTLNEEESIKNVLTKTNKYADKIIVVDSSTDRTPQIIRNNFPNVILLREERKGKGLAIRKGIKKALELNSKFIVFLDADGEKDPQDIKKLIGVLKYCDVVIGKRNKMRSLNRKFLNSFTNWWIRLVTGFKILDVTSGFIGIKTNALRNLRLSSIGFEIEIEFVLEAFKNNLKLIEVPIKVPKFSNSKLNLRHMLEINTFFDEWVLKWLRTEKMPLSKKIFLLFFCSIGLLAKLIKK